MSADPFTDAARAEAERQFPAPLYNTAWSQSEVQIKRALWESGAEWARAHLAAQEPTDAEVEAAAIMLCASAHHELVWKALAKVEPKRQEHFRNMARAAMSAARAPRRDEEKR